MDGAGRSLCGGEWGWSCVLPSYCRRCSLPVNSAPTGASFLRTCARHLYRGATTEQQRFGSDEDVSDDDDDSSNAQAAQGRRGASRGGGGSVSVTAAAFPTGPFEVSMDSGVYAVASKWVGEDVRDGARELLFRASCVLLLLHLFFLRFGFEISSSPCIQFPKAEREDDGSLKLERILGFRERWGQNEAASNNNSSGSNSHRPRPGNNTALDQVQIYCLQGVRMSRGEGRETSWIKD